MAATDPREVDHDRLRRVAVELLNKHVQVRRQTSAWGELAIVLTFRQGFLAEVKTLDETRIRPDLLDRHDPASDTSSSQSS